MTDWWPDETLRAGAEHLDPGYVAGYDAKAQYDPTDDVAALQELGLGAGSRLVDLGAGTGALAFAAAELGAEAVAVDVSPAMVASMVRRRERSAAGARLHIVEAGFLGYEHDGSPADFVFSRNALHQLPDFWKVIALRRIRDLLRPGGVLRVRDLAFDVEPDDVERTVAAWMASAAEDPAAGYTASELAAHLRDEFGTFTWLLESMLERTGFEIVDRETVRSTYVAYSCRRTG